MTVFCLILKKHKTNKMIWSERGQINQYYCRKSASEYKVRSKTENWIQLLKTRFAWLASTVLQREKSFGIIISNSLPNNSAPELRVRPKKWAFHFLLALFCVIWQRRPWTVKKGKEQGNGDASSQTSWGPRHVKYKHNLFSFLHRTSFCMDIYWRGQKGPFPACETRK